MKIFLTFLAAYMLSQFFRSFLAVIAPELAVELSLDPQRLAHMQAWWIAGFVAMQIPVGWALDRVGPRRTVSVVMAVAVAGAALLARAQSPFDLNLAMAMIGIGCSAIFMGALYFFGRQYRPAQFALLSSWLLGLGTAGNLAAASPLAMAATTIGWRGAMMALAALTAASALAVALVVRDPPPVTTHPGEGLAAGLWSVLAIRPLWPLLPLTAVSYAVVLAERGLWAGPYFAEVHGLAAVPRGHALLLLAAAMSAGAMFYGPLDRHLGTRKWIVAAGTLVTAGCFLWLGLADHSLASALVAISTLGLFGMTYGVLMAHGRSFFPDHLLGRGITVMNVLFIGGAGVLQPLTGRFMTLMADAPRELAFGRLHTAFGLVLVGALAIYLFAKDRKP